MPPKKEKGKKRKELPTAFLPDTPAWPTSEGTQPPAPRPAPPAPPRNSGAPILVGTCVEIKFRAPHAVDAMVSL